VIGISKHGFFEVLKKKIRAIEYHRKNFHRQAEKLEQSIPKFWEKFSS